VHLDCLACARIATDAGIALLHCEGAEPTQLDALAARQSGSDLLEYRRNDEFGILLPQMRAAGGEFRDEFCPGQRRRPHGSLSTQSEQRGSMLPGLAANQYRQSGHCRLTMPGIGSHGSALIARVVASFSHPVRLFIGHTPPAASCS
jgi:hypothetical protein